MDSYVIEIKGSRIPLSKQEAVVLSIMLTESLGKQDRYKEQEEIRVFPMQGILKWDWYPVDREYGISLVEIGGKVE